MIALGTVRTRVAAPFASLAAVSGVPSRSLDYVRRKLKAECAQDVPWHRVSLACEGQRLDTRFRIIPFAPSRPREGSAF